MIKSFKRIQEGVFLGLLDVFRGCIATIHYRVCPVVGVHVWIQLLRPDSGAAAFGGLDLHCLQRLSLSWTGGASHSRALSGQGSRRCPSVVAACPAHCHPVLSSRDNVQCCNAFWVMLGHKKTHLAQPLKDTTLESGHSKHHLYR